MDDFLGIMKIVQWIISLFRKKEPKQQKSVNSVIASPHANALNATVNGNNSSVQITSTPLTHQKKKTIGPKMKRLFLLII